MTGRTRRVFEMCVRVLGLARSRTRTMSQVVRALVAQLHALVARMTQVIDDQRGGRIDDPRGGGSEAGAPACDARRARSPTWPRSGRLAAREVHELRSMFAFKPTADTLVAFQSAARWMYAAAQKHSEILVQHGLSASVLVQFGEVAGRVRRGDGAWGRRAGRCTRRRRGSWTR